MGIRHWITNLFKPNVAEMKANGNVAKLVNAMVNDSRISREAEAALLEMGSSAVKPLIGLLNGDFERRLAVARILAQIVDPRCVEPLIGLLKDDSILCEIATRGLAKQKTVGSIEALCNALTKYDAYVKLLAARALEEIADASAVTPLIRVAQDPKASVHVQTLLRSVLDRDAVNVPTDVLRQAAQMNDSYVLIFAQIDTSCSFVTFNVTDDECDFTQIKQMARQELIRRGLDA